MEGRPKAHFVTFSAHFVPNGFPIARLQLKKRRYLISRHQLTKTNPMKKTILALVLAAGLTSFAGSAKAVITYNFSLTGSKYGNFSGVLTTPSISDLGADSSVWWFNGHGYDLSLIHI